jgi:hypothetical protein
MIVEARRFSIRFSRYRSIHRGVGVSCVSLEGMVLSRREEMQRDCRSDACEFNCGRPAFRLMLALNKAGKRSMIPKLTVSRL